MFVKSNVIIPALVINCIARATIVAGSQAVVATFFPSEHIGTLTGIMWTAGGAITFIQYALVLLTDDICKIGVFIPLGLGDCASTGSDYVLPFSANMA
ncbi:unnamed protein product [Adineta ricciae]|uniref:Uncharacterized protein n=1 Tax=Adineta ricciae TaxID=249248 RepID=A0A815NAS4_ADIRI|nr:unnamed protein product [Adineta ricciae]CAF1434725.1 unnamed protein product [Adineta ricciae]